MTKDKEAPAVSVADRAKRKLERDLGPDFLAALFDEETQELMLNPDGTVWLDRRGEPLRHIGDLRPAQGQAIIETVAGLLGKTITRDVPLLEGEFPLDGSRFAGQLPPTVHGPTFAIRRKASAVFPLSKYVEDGIMSEDQKSVIEKAVNDHRNILVVGGTGSGKTTLVNSIIQAMVEYSPHERIVIIEDTGEIQCAAANHIKYHTTIDVSMTDLLKTTLRMRPDRILVGEVRGPEALDLLMAWNTGHEGGTATLHANSAFEALSRLTSLVSMNPNAPREIEPLVGKAVHVIVHIAKTPDHGRKVSGILSVSDYQNGQFVTDSL